MTDAERIITLRRSGFDNHTIAAMVGVDTADVRDALSGVDPLPAGAGGLPNYSFLTTGAIPAANLLDNVGSRPGNDAKGFVVAAPITLTCDPGESAEASLLAWTMDGSQGYTLDNVRLAVAGGASQVQQRARLKGTIPPGFYAQVTVNEGGGGTAVLANSFYSELA